MRGEQRLAAQTGVVVQMLNHGVGDGQPVISAGAAPDFVQYQQRPMTGLVENGGGFHHFHHKSGLPGSQVVLQADAGKDTVHQADLGMVGGHETANLRQQHNQRHLPDVSGFAGHIGAGNQHNLGILGVHGGVVGDIGAGVQHPFHHRMPTARNADGAALVEDGADIAMPHGDGGQSGEHIGAGNGGGEAGYGGPLVGNLPADLAVQGAFQLLQPLPGVQYLAFVLFQLRRNKPLGAGEGLTALIIRRHGVQVGAADLNVVAENLVVAHFEAADAGAFPFPAFQPGDKTAGIPG